MKSKNAPQARLQKIPAWFPLLIAACLLLVGFVLKTCSNGYLEPRGVAMFYPLAIVLKSSWQNLLQGLIGGGVILLHLLALKRGVDPNDVFGSALITGIFVVVVAGLSPFHAYEMIPLQALSTEDHTYRLVLRHWGNSDTNPSMYAPHSLYVVLECDRSGLICGYLVTPTACIEEGATLVLEPTTQRVLMLMGTKVYDVKAMEDVSYPICITKGLER
jgi:hypothetical protein